ncbi:MAG: hypothetical protein Kow0090_17240 [Myxococcota bacterium]
MLSWFELEWLRSEYFWLALCVALFLLEPILPYLYATPWAIAALFTALLAAILSNAIPVFILFFIFALLGVFLFLTLRPILCYYIYAGRQQTNIAALIGRETVVLEEARRSGERKGSVKIDGVVWSVLPRETDILAPQTAVRVLEVRGNTLIVEDVSRLSPPEKMPDALARRMLYIIKKGSAYWIRK